MNGKLLICLLSLAALAVTVHGDCATCNSKATDFSTAKSAADICKFAKTYLDCLTSENCGVGTDVVKKALETGGCSAGRTVVISMFCLFLGLLLNKLIN